MTQQLDGEGDHPAQIRVLRDGATVTLEIELRGQPPVKLTLPEDVAMQVGFRMMGASEIPVGDPRAFFEPQVLAVSEPAVEVHRSDSGTISIAFKATEMRPIIFQLRPDRAAEIANGILDMIGGGVR
jgi:hypothetical protein